jgi:hypothetical protein
MADCSVRRLLQRISGGLVSILVACIGFSLVLAYVSAKPKSVNAFNSFPGAKNVHRDITVDALSQLGFSYCSIAVIVDADDHQDWDEYLSSKGIDGITLFSQTKYDALDHFDRPDADSPQHTLSKIQFQYSAKRIEDEIKQVVSDVNNGDDAQALKGIGSAMHALQDFFAHSNFIDLSSTERQQALTTLFSPDAFDPLGNSLPDLRLTAYKPVPAALYGDPEAPPSDSDITACTTSSYSHRACAKDSSTKNTESGIILTGVAAEVCPAGPCYKYDAAYYQAVLASASLVSMIENNFHLSVNQLESLENPPCRPGGASPPNIPTRVVTSNDPNDKTGSLGNGPLRYISGGTPLRYAIAFSNEPTATAPVGSITITEQLDTSNDDLRTFNLGPISIPGQNVFPPPGLADFSTTIDLRPASNLLVAITTHLDTSTGVLTWKFQSLDPATNEPPTDPSVGFVSAGAGGSVFFTVMPKGSVATGTQIQNQAAVVFDKNAAMPTPIWSNAIDQSSPASHVLALAANSGLPGFLVQWAGSDAGSGVQSYSIFVSDNGGAFTIWQMSTPANSANFIGQAGHSYGFYSIATDNVGNVEATKTTAEASTTVATSILKTPIVTVSPSSTNITTLQSLAVTVAVTGPSGSSTPTGYVTLTSESYTSTALSLNSGIASIAIPAGALAVGTDNLTASYTPDLASSTTYISASGTTSVAVTVPAKITPTVTVLPSSSGITKTQAISVSVSVNGGSGNPTPTGTVTLTSGGYTSPLATLTSGGATIDIPGGSLSIGSDTLTVSYTPDSTSSTTFNSSTGTASVIVTTPTYSMSATGVTVPKGGTGNSTVTVSSANGFAGTVNLTCAIASSPAGATDLPTCTSSQAVTLSSSTTSGTATVTLDTTAAHSSAFASPKTDNGNEYGAVGGTVLTLLAILGIPARRRGWKSLLSVLILMVLLTSLAACGGGSGGAPTSSNPGTTAGAYTITVSGSGNDSANTKVTTTFTLTVN